MADLKREIRFDLPIKIVLTGTGIDFFLANKRKLQKFRTIDNDEAYGIVLQNASLPAIQQMILFDYVSKIEVSREEFLSKRYAIMDLSKLVAYSVLYRHFDYALFTHLVHSDLIVQWNRQNPGAIIDSQTKMSTRQLQDFVKRHEADIDGIKQSILGPIGVQLKKSSRLNDEEKALHQMIAEKFLDKLRPLIWFGLVENRQASGFRQALESIQALLSKYIDKSRIAEYLTLLMLELITNAENTNIQAYIKASHRNNLDTEAVFHDEALREQIIEELRRADERIYVSWKIRGRGSSLGTESKLQITIFNREGEYYTLRDSINSKKNIDVRKKSLMEFYNDVPDAVANRELGLYYITYLNDECQKREIHFESSVNYMPSTGLTVTTLTLNF